MIFESFSFILAVEIFWQVSCVTMQFTVFALDARKSITVAPFEKLALKCQALLDRTNFNLERLSLRYNGCQPHRISLPRRVPTR